MWRLIFLGLIVWFIFYILKRNVSQSSTPKTSKEKTVDDSDIGNKEKVENMVQCAACAVHLPRSEAFLVDGTFYCCKAHIQSK